MWPQLPMQLPTDSVYKFAALAGVVLVAVALSLGGWFAVTSERDLVAAQKSAAQFELDAELNQLEREQVATLRSSYGEQRHAELSARATYLRALTQANLALVGRMRRTRRVVASTTVAMLCLGTALMLAGFPLWYFRNQVLLDRLLLKQVAEAERPHAVEPAIQEIQERVRDLWQDRDPLRTPWRHPRK